MLKPLGVRRLTADDAAPLSLLCEEHARFERTAFEAEGHQQALAHWLQLQQVVAFGLEGADRQLNGYASLTIDVSTLRAAPFAHLDCLFLREAYRGQGLGRALLQAAVNHARAANLRVMEWQTPAWNAPAQRFYDSLGAQGCAKQRYAWALDAGVSP